jgi:hypothetical protein
VTPLRPVRTAAATSSRTRSTWWRPEEVQADEGAPMSRRRRRRRRSVSTKSACETIEKSSRFVRRQCSRRAAFFRAWKGIGRADTSRWDRPVLARCHERLGSCVLWPRAAHGVRQHVTVALSVGPGRVGKSSPVFPGFAPRTEGTFEGGQNRDHAVRTPTNHLLTTRRCVRKVVLAFLLGPTTRGSNVASVYLQGVDPSFLGRVVTKKSFSCQRT